MIRSVGLHSRNLAVSHGLTGPQAPLLQERFARCFAALEEWEQRLLLASLQCIAPMMDAGDIDAAPVLSSGSVWKANAAKNYKACRYPDRRLDRYS
ncbi:MAG: hypothetical protein P8Z31_10755 [Gammaproteobacteria bacterium]